MAEARAVKFCTQVGYVMSYQKNKGSPPKGVWLWSRDLFKFLIPPVIFPEWLKLETSNLVQCFARWQFSIGITNFPLNGRGHGHVTSVNFRLYTLHCIYTCRIYLV